jgi:hypothetical protein
MAKETEFAVIESSQLIWRTSVQMSARRFRLFVAADTAHTTADQISAFAEAALGRGMVYFCAWGPGCDRFHDIVDEVVVGDELAERSFAPPTAKDVVMTTWHARETLEEALDFFATCAVPTDGYAADSSYRVVMCVGNPQWASVATRFLKAAKFLI